MPSPFVTVQTVCQSWFKTHRWPNYVDCARAQDCNKNNVTFFAETCNISNADESDQSKRSMTNFTQHLLHWVSFQLYGSLLISWSCATTTIDEYQTNSNYYCRFKMKWTYWSFFHMSFHWKIQCKSCHTNLKNFSIVYTCMLCMEMNNSAVKLVIWWI